MKCERENGKVEGGSHSRELLGAEQALKGTHGRCTPNKSHRNRKLKRRLRITNPTFTINQEQPICSQALEEDEYQKLGGTCFVSTTEGQELVNKKKTKYNNSLKRKKRKTSKLEKEQPSQSESDPPNSSETRNEQEILDNEQNNRHR